jgi:lysophospholipase L1-like esterase
VLAAISVGTVLVMAVMAEAGTRIWWPEQERNACVRKGVNRPIAGCTTRLKNAEGPWTTMTYNACGYRSAHACGPKPSGTRRLVVMGKSVSEGLYVPYEEHFATRVERALTAGCGFPVESQSLGSLGVTADRQPALLPEVLGLEPDVVVIPLDPYDMNYFADNMVDETAGHDVTPVSPASTPIGGVAPAAPGAADAPSPPAKRRAAPTQQEHFSLLTRLRLISRESRALLIAQHFMLVNDAFLMRAYQLGQEEDALRTPSSPAFQRRYTRLETVIRGLATTLGARGVPLVIVPVPNRIEAALVSDRVTLPRVDPMAFSRELHAIGARTGVPVADVFPRFAAHLHAERLFYAVDGHPSGDANALIAAALQQTLTTVPAFSGCRISD